MPRLRALVTVIALCACRYQEVPRCQTGFEELGEADLSRTLVLDVADLSMTVSAQLISPAETGRHDGRAPTAVFVQGGWGDEGVPVRNDTGRLPLNMGIATVYLDLSPTDAPGDRRGPVARSLVAAALRYAAGLDRDTKDCTIDQRMVPARSESLALAAYSNGGNLAWQTLGDPSLDLPQVHGIAGFETPSAGQFAMAEPGTNETASPLDFATGCALDAETNGLSCPVAYGPIGFDPGANPDTGGVLFLDLDADQLWSEDQDFALGGVWSPTDSAWMHSSPARMAAAQSGVGLIGRAGIEPTVLFWSEREAPQAMAAAAERFPDLAGIEVGTEVDHVLSGMDAHPHVVGMTAAMQAAGLGWTRLHPDAAYAQAVQDSDRDFADLAANAPVSLDASAPPMEPDEDETLTGPNYLGAAVLELLDRHWTGDWSDDLDATLAH